MRASILSVISLLESDEHLMRSDKVAEAVKTLREAAPVDYKLVDDSGLPMNAGNLLAAKIVADDLAEAQAGAVATKEVPQEINQLGLLAEIMVETRDLIESLNKGMEELIAVASGNRA